MLGGVGENIDAEGVAGGVGFAVHETEEIVQGVDGVADGAEDVAEDVELAVFGAGCVADGAGLAASGEGDFVPEAECGFVWYGACGR